MTDKHNPTHSGQVLLNHFSPGYLHRAAQYAENSTWQPVVLQDAVAVYARRSSEVENESIERQDQRSETYAKEALNKKVSYRFSDEGFSGETSFRPGLEELLREARAGKFNIVIIEDVDRFGRRFGIIGTIFDALEDLGIEVHSLFKRGILQRADVILKSLAATDHQTQLRDRIKGGKDIAIAKGRIVSHMPYGYERDPSLKGHYRVNAQLRAPIAWAFEARRSGISTAVIREGMNNMIADPNFHLRDRHYVSRLLQHPIYKGVYIHGRVNFRRVDGKIRRRMTRPDEWNVHYHENLRIVDDVLWNEVHNSFDHSQRRPPIRRLLSGKVYCMSCGQKMHGNDSCSTRPVYRCCLPVNGPRCDGGTSIVAHKLESVAFEAISKVLAAEGLEDMFQSILDEEIGKQREAIEKQQGELKRVQADKKKELELEVAVYKQLFAEARASGKQLPTFMSERTDQLAKELEELNFKLSALPDLAKRILVTPIKRKHLLEVFEGVSKLAGKHAADIRPEELANIALMADVIERVDVSLVEGSRSYIATVHVSPAAAVGQGGVDLLAGHGGRCFKYHIHRTRGGRREHTVLKAFEARAHFLSDAEFDLVWSQFGAEIDALAIDLSRVYGIRRILDLTTFICTTSWHRRALHACGVPTPTRAMKLTRALFSTGTWARIAALLEREFPHRTGTFNPDMPWMFNQFRN